MSIRKNIIQQNGLIHVSSTREDTDMGIVGEYTNGGTKYAGIIRDRSGVWHAFHSNDNPFPTNIAQNYIHSNIQVSGLLADNITSDNLDIKDSESTYINFSNDIITANKSINTTHITGPTSVINKDYVLSWNYKAACQCVTTENLSVIASGSGPTHTLTSTINETLATRASSLDTIVISELGTRILVRQQTASENNGIYVVTDAGSTLSPWILTRAEDLNATQHFSNGIIVHIISGHIYGDARFKNNNSGLILETDTITFTLCNIISNIQEFTSSGSIYLQDNISDALSIRNYGTLDTLVTYSTASHSVNFSADVTLSPPIGQTSAITKDYVDLKNYKNSVRVKTTVTLALSLITGTTIENSAQNELIIDGITLEINDRILVANQSNNNGIYYVSTIGNGWVLTKTVDDSMGSDDYVFISQGDTWAGTFWSSIDKDWSIVGTNVQNIKFNGDTITVNGSDNNALKIINNETTYLTVDSLNNSVTIPNLSSSNIIASSVTFDENINIVKGEDELITITSNNVDIPILSSNNASITGIKHGVTTISSSQTLGTNAVINVSGTITLTLPDATQNSGRIYRIVKTDNSSTTCTIVTSGDDLIDGSISTILLIDQYDFTQFTSHGLIGWFIH